MKTTPTPPTTIDAYIAACPPAVRPVLEKIRATVRKAAPGAEEKISYRMPCFAQQGVLVYVGAFTGHIGLFPPVRDEALRQEVAAYAGPKGNLQFPLDQPIPYALIGKIVRARVKENAAKAAAKKKKAEDGG